MNLETAILSALVSVAATLLVLALPGYAWVSWFPLSTADSVEELARAVGLSVAFTAVGALVLYLLGWHPSGGAMIATYGAMGVVAMCGRRRTPWKLTSGGLLAMGAFGLIVLWRFLQMRGLVLPAWVDSPQHVLIVRQILETGGLPSTLLPYVPVPFYYHFGFHVIAASFTFWAGLPAAQSVLELGQILNAAVALSVYRLARVTWRDRKRAVLAAGLVAFVSEMPAFYAAWGRYPLLTGMLLLPLAIAKALELRQRSAHGAPLQPGSVSIIELALLTAGVLLSHYLAGLLLAIFFVVAGLPMVLTSLRRVSKGRSMKPETTPHAWFQGHGLGVAGLMLGAGGGLLLAAPWLWRVWALVGQRFFAVRTATPFASTGPDSLADYGTYIFALLGPPHSQFLLLLAIAGLFTVTGRPRTRWLAVWTGLLVLAGLPWGIRLGPFRPDHFAIVLFVPVCLLAAHALVSLLDRLPRPDAQPVARALWMGTVMLLLLWGVRDTRSIVNPTTVLAGQADLQALRWIQENVPAGARFLTNVTSWQPGIYRGVDGGSWILPYTGRQTLVPPIIYAWADEEYVSRVNRWADQAATLTGCTPDLWDLVENAGVTHIYLTSGRGGLRPEDMGDCPRVQLRYAEAGAYVFSVAPP